MMGQFQFSLGHIGSIMGATCGKHATNLGREPCVPVSQDLSTPHSTVQAVQLTQDADWAALRRLWHFSGFAQWTHSRMHEPLWETIRIAITHMDEAFKNGIRANFELLGGNGIKPS